MSKKKTLGTREQLRKLRVQTEDARQRWLVLQRNAIEALDDLLRNLQGLKVLQNGGGVELMTALDLEWGAVIVRQLTKVEKLFSEFRGILSRFEEVVQEQEKRVSKARSITQGLGTSSTPMNEISNLLESITSSKDMWKAELSLKQQIFSKLNFPLPEDYEDLQKLFAAEVCVNNDILEFTKM